ncbi:MAG TPA: glycosyltransferase [Bryobacteraceae bacterium]|nr:glycosyltransferase [Bryobacteraceae bacterium]
MKILLTNITLASRTGTEIVTRDLALGLAAAGHTPAVFCPKDGPVAQEIRNGGVPVLTELSEMTDVPDVIHGHHHVETTAALLHFPDTPAIFVCHDRFSWHDVPPPSEQIRRYVAVDLNCLERLTAESGIPVEKTRVIHNAVDIRRFDKRRELLDKPQRALIFSNYAAKGTHLEPVLEACSLLGLPCDIVGSGVDASSERPEHLLPGYDIVFAKARCALEAIAAGAAVVLCDSAGLGPMVKFSDLPMLRDWNFGRRCLQQRLTPGAIASEVMKYDAADAQAVSLWVRNNASLDSAIEAYTRLYAEVIEEARSAPVHVTISSALRSVVKACADAQASVRSGSVLRTTKLPKACVSQITVRPVDPIRSVEAGTSTQLLVALENASRETLISRDPYPVLLAYHWIDPVSQEMVIAEGQRTSLTVAVPPSTVHRQAQLVEAPQAPGSYILRLTLVQEFVFWFESVHAGTATDLRVEVRASGEPDFASRNRTPAFDLEQATRWTDGLTIVRNGRFANAGFIDTTAPESLTFVESRRFAMALQHAPSIACVLTTPDLINAVPEHLGLAVCDQPRTRFVDIHNHLATNTNFYWRDFPTTIHPTARIHPAALVAPLNVTVGAGTIIEANAVIAERVMIGDRCTVQSGAILGAEGFQTDRSGEHFREMLHAGAVRVDADARVFAGAIIARGLFRELTSIGSQARIGNRAFVSHNVQVGSRSFVGHGAVVNGNVRIGEGAWVGPQASIANGLCIGANAHVGLGSTVIRDVERDARVLGAIAVRSDRMLRFAAGLEKHQADGREGNDD